MLSQIKTFAQANKTSLIQAMFMLAFMAVLASSAHAGAGGTEFDEVWDMIKDWTQGSLGRVIAGGMVLMGVAAGMARQSLMAFALGVGGAMGLYYAPTILESIMTATLPVAVKVAPFAAQLTTGLGM